MALEVRRKPNESPESILRRFTRRMMQSRILQNVKGSRFYKKKKTKLAMKVAALRRKTLQQKYAYLRVIGKMPVDERAGRRSGNNQRTTTNG